MFVDDVMTREVRTVEERTPVGRAWAIMQVGRFRHLPVVDHGELVGIVSDRELQLAIARADGNMQEAGTVGAIMWRGVSTTTPQTPVEEAGRLMLQLKIGALPVVDGGQVVGIVTESDLFRVLISLLGAQEPSSRIELELIAPTRQLAQLTALASDLDVPLISLITGPSNQNGVRTVILRVACLEPGPFVRALEAAGIYARVPIPA